MTEQQRKNLTTVATAIAAGRPTVSESFAVGQLMLVTGKPWRDCLKGVEIMQREKAFPGEFIKPETMGAIRRLTSCNPTVADLLDRFDLLPGATEVLEFQGFCRPKKVTIEGLVKKFSIDAF